MKIVYSYKEAEEAFNNDDTTKVLCLSNHTRTFLEVNDIKSAKIFYINTCEEPHDISSFPLSIEVDSTGAPLSYDAKRYKTQNITLKTIDDKQKIEEYLNYYRLNHHCLHHLVYDVATPYYDMRYCAVCGKYIATV